MSRGWQSAWGALAPSWPCQHTTTTCHTCAHTCSYVLHLKAGRHNGRNQPYHALQQTTAVLPPATCHRLHAHDTSTRIGAQQRGAGGHRNNTVPCTQTQPRRCGNTGCAWPPRDAPKLSCRGHITPTARRGEGLVHRLSRRRHKHWMTAACEATVPVVRAEGGMSGRRTSATPTLPLRSATRMYTLLVSRVCRMYTPPPRGVGDAWLVAKSRQHQVRGSAPLEGAADVRARISCAPRERNLHGPPAAHLGYGARPPGDELQPR